MKRYAPLLLTFLFLPLLFSCFDLEEDLYDQLEKEDYYTDYESLMASVLRPYEHAKWGRLISLSGCKSYRRINS